MSSQIQDIQTAKGIVVSVNHAKKKNCIKELFNYQRAHLVANSPSVLSLVRPCDEMGYSDSQPSRKNRRTFFLQHQKIFDLVVAVTSNKSTSFQTPIRDVKLDDGLLA